MGERPAWKRVEDGGRVMDAVEGKLSMACFPVLEPIGALQCKVVPHSMKDDYRILVCKNADGGERVRHNDGTPPAPAVQELTESGRSEGGLAACQ